VCVGGGGQCNALLPSPTPMAGPQAPHQLNPALGGTKPERGSGAQAPAGSRGRAPGEWVTVAELINK